MPAAAPITVVVVIKIVIWGIAIVIALCFLWDVGKKIWILITNPPCKLQKHILMGDECKGSCPVAGAICVASATRPYFWGAFGVQDAACACGAAGSGVAGGTGAPVIGGSSTIKKAKESLKPADKHTDDTNEAIDEAGK